MTIKTSLNILARQNTSKVDEAVLANNHSLLSLEQFALQFPENFTAAELIEFFQKIDPFEGGEENQPNLLIYNCIGVEDLTESDIEVATDKGYSVATTIT